MTSRDADSTAGDTAKAGSDISHYTGGECVTWRASDIKPGDWRLSLPGEVIEELDALARTLNHHEGPIEDLVPTAFQLPATSELMAQVSDRLDRGPGFALLDRLPLEHWDERTSRAIAFLVISLLGPVVMQKYGGTRIYDVKDTGTTMGHGVRRSITNLEQEFHTDGGWLAETPEIVALVCLRQAAKGGASRVVNLANVHNILSTRHANLLPELYRTFWWDRQAEHPKDQQPCSRRPVYSRSGGRLAARYYDDYIRQGHRLMNAPLGQKARSALETMQTLVEEPENWIEFQLERGQIEFVNNRLLAHSRTAFSDTTGSEGRHLLRLWVRRNDDISFEPGAPPAD